MWYNIAIATTEVTTGLKLVQWSRIVMTFFVKNQEGEDGIADGGNSSVMRRPLTPFTVGGSHQKQNGSPQQNKQLCVSEASRQDQWNANERLISSNRK